MTPPEDHHGPDEEVLDQVIREEAEEEQRQREHEATLAAQDQDAVEAEAAIQEAAELIYPHLFLQRLEGGGACKTCGNDLSHVAHQVRNLDELAEFNRLCCEMWRTVQEKGDREISPGLQARAMFVVGCIAYETVEQMAMAMKDMKTEEDAATFLQSIGANVFAAVKKTVDEMDDSTGKPI